MNSGRLCLKPPGKESYIVVKDGVRAGSGKNEQFGAARELSNNVTGLRFEEGVEKEDGIALTGLRFDERVEKEDDIAAREDV